MSRPRSTSSDDGPSRCSATSRARPIAHGWPIRPRKSSDTSTSSSTTRSTDGNFSLVRGRDLDDWRTTFDVNLFGTLQLTQALLPLLKEQRRRPRHHDQHACRRSRIEPLYGAYAASKAALATATKTLARELGPVRHPGQRHPPRLHLGLVGGVVPQPSGRAARHHLRGGVRRDRRSDLPGLPHRRPRRSPAPWCSSRRR